MRVLVAHNVDSARPGGMSRMMGFLHDELCRLGHEVDYVTQRDVRKTARGRLAPLLFGRTVAAVARLAASRGRAYDIINIHEPVAAGLFTARGGDLARIVVMSHGVEQRSWDLAQEEERLGRGKIPLRTRVTHATRVLLPSKYALRKADHVFCCNYDDQKFLVETLGIAATRITRIFPGAHEVFATIASNRDYSRWERLLFAGTWRKNKGVEDLIPAFVDLARTDEKLCLVVLGPGIPLADVYSAFPVEFRERVEVTEAESEVDIARVFAQSDLFILPSLFEGTPLTLIEAMMSGMPIVTTSTCGMKDIIEDGRNGLLIPIRKPQAIATAIRQIIDSPGRRKRLGCAARDDALRQFTWPHVAKRVVSAYESIGAAGNMGCSTA